MPAPTTPYSSDYWLYKYLYTPLAIQLCFIHPNWITFAALLLIIPIVFSLLYHSPLWTVIGLFEGRAVLDCLDGAMARASHTKSKWGAAFDRFGDDTFLTTICITLLYIVGTKYSIYSWKMGILGLIGLTIVGFLACDTSVYHDNYTLFNGLWGYIAWFLANRF